MLLCSPGIACSLRSLTESQVPSARAGAVSRGTQHATTPDRWQHAGQRRLPSWRTGRAVTWSVLQEFGRRKCARLEETGKAPCGKWDGGVD